MAGMLVIACCMKKAVAGLWPAAAFLVCCARFIDGLGILLSSNKQLINY
jgi:hypothetical protein